MSITYGIDIKLVDDRFFKASLEASDAIAAVMAPGKFLVDVIPIRACICAQTVIYNLKHLKNYLSYSTVHFRLVPRDGVQGSC